MLPSGLATADRTSQKSLKYRVNYMQPVCCQQRCSLDTNNRNKNKVRKDKEYEQVRGRSISYLIVQLVETQTDRIYAEVEQEENTGKIENKMVGYDHTRND